MGRLPKGNHRKPSAPRCQALKKMLSASDFTPGVSIDPGMDLARLLGLNDQLHEEALDLSTNLSLRLPKVIQDDVNPITLEGNGPRSSSSFAIRSSLPSSLGSPRGLRPRRLPLGRRLRHQPPQNSENPDLVIQEIAERKLMQPAQALRLTQPLKRDNGKWHMVDSTPK